VSRNPDRRQQYAIADFDSDTGPDTGSQPDESCLASILEAAFHMPEAHPWRMKRTRIHADSHGYMERSVRELAGPAGISGGKLPSVHPCPKRFWLCSALFFGTDSHAPGRIDGA
jgi:hypothetical protein